MLIFLNSNIEKKFAQCAATIQLCVLKSLWCLGLLLQGFKYFATHLRGREEMICSIINEPSVR